MICDPGERYLDTYCDRGWPEDEGLASDPFIAQLESFATSDPYIAQLESFAATGEFAAG